MKDILIIYPSMMKGGSTTSLLSILRLLDPNEYNVDILFFNELGPLHDELPTYVNVLPFACKYDSRKKIRYRKLLSLRSNLTYLRGKLASAKSGQAITGQQLIQHDTVRLCRKVEKKYDIAISFLELWSMYYLVDNVKAKKKIAWIHFDYVAAKFRGKYDRKAFSNIDNIVFVSDECLKKFQQAVPQFASKAICIENILISDTIRAKAMQSVDFEIEKDRLNLVTTCRISFYHKGIDRALNALIRLKSQGALNGIRWYIIGDGQDFDQLSLIIEKEALQDVVIPLGYKANPFPYMAKCDVFFLPSRFEGKPMAVTEAMMLGLVPVVTNYASAEGQVENNVDGLILDNTDEAVYYGIKEMINNPSKVMDMKRVVESRDYSNSFEMERVLQLFN